MAVQHHLRLRRGVGREIEEQRVRGAGLALGRVLVGTIVGVLEAVPARRAADRDPGVGSGETREARHKLGRHDHVTDAAALEAVLKVRFREKRGGGNDDGAQLHEAEHRLPQLAHIGQEHRPAERLGIAATVEQEIARRE
jgi:hypothetical protein